MDVLDPRGLFLSCLCVTSDWLCTTVQFGQVGKYFAPPIVAASLIIIIVISSNRLLQQSAVNKLLFILQPWILVEQQCL